MFCRQCHYDLRDLPEPRCPECGTPFDPQDAKTFLWEVPDKRLEVAKSVIAYTIGAGLAGLYWRSWRRSQARRSLHGAAGRTEEEKDGSIVQSPRKPYNAGFSFTH